MKIILLLSLFISSSCFSISNIEKGEKLAQQCVACHGLKGNKIIANNPVLAGQHYKYLFKQLTEFKLATSSKGKEGRSNPIMQGIVQNLSTQDMKDLSMYFSKQKKITGFASKEAIIIADSLYKGGDKTRGIVACLACHGPRGNGTSLTGFPRISGQNIEYTKQQLLSFKYDKRKNDMNGMMRTTVKNLTEEEISALASYLNGLY